MELRPGQSEKSSLAAIAQGQGINSDVFGANVGTASGAEYSENNAQCIRIGSSSEKPDGLIQVTTGMRALYDTVT